MSKPLKILKQYWGHSQFRPLQQEIIHSVLESKDTLALLPTGGGKSVCFQIPGLLLEGVTLVVSPIIALMKDQTEQLLAKGIDALALHSGLGTKERKLAYTNMVNGKYKFIYVSPERIVSEDFRGYLYNMNIQLLVIDEAHCISQWGYDFRPSYIKISEIYDLLPNTKKIALTASATPKVIEDLKEKLKFRNCQVFKASFIRNNLSYSVLNENKPKKRLLNLIYKVKGSGLVFANSRRKTIEYAKLLTQNGINADYFHAGLSNEEKNIKQENWIIGKTRILVCTNAFGMGIDKANVRFVVHLHIPQSIEEYYQEAGRAGRDGKKAYCAIIVNLNKENKDQYDVFEKYPKKETLDKVYQSLSKFLSVAYGSGQDSIHNFDFKKFINTYQLPSLTTFTSLKLLQTIGLIHLSEGIYMPSKLHIKVKDDAYNFYMETHPKTQNLLSILLRIYGGIFDYHTKIDEEKIGKNIGWSKQEVIKSLKKISQDDIIDYLPREDSPRITFLENRTQSIDVDLRKVSFLRTRYTERILSVLNYLSQLKKCRNAIIAEYFGDETHFICGICDNCLRNILKEPALKKWRDKFKPIILAEKISPHQLVEKNNGIKREQAKRALAQLAQQKIITTDKQGNLVWVKK